MYLIFAFAFGLLHAEVGSVSVEALFRNLQNQPPRVRAEQETDAAAFRAELQKFLRARAQASSRLSPIALLDVMEAYAATNVERSALFALLADPQNGLTAFEAAQIMMSGRFFEYEQKALTPARAFERSLSAELDKSAVPSPHQLELFEELAKYMTNIDEWKEMAIVAQNWQSRRAAVSRALVSNIVQKMRGWKTKPPDWGYLLSFYRPDEYDTLDCIQIVSAFETLSILRFALRFVGDSKIRVGLQEAALLAMKQPSAGWVRTVLSPIGDDVDEVYLTTLDRLRTHYLKYVRRPECDHLLAVWTNDEPLLSLNPREKPEFTVIEGGLRSSP